MQWHREQCFLVFEMLALQLPSLTCCCYLHIQPLVFMCNICHWSNSLQPSNHFCLFPLAGKLIENNWMVMCFSRVLLLVDIGVLYGLCNKSVSLLTRVLCSRNSGVWHCLSCEGTKWESSGQDFCISFFAWITRNSIGTIQIPVGAVHVYATHKRNYSTFKLEPVSNGVRGHFPIYWFRIEELLLDASFL